MEPITTENDIFKAILDKFQTERNRLAEESFARTFSESEEVRLFFINIEDAYIEAVGTSVYDNIEIYLMFNRIAPAFAKKEVESSASEKFKLVKSDVNQKKIQTLIDYLDYMTGFLLFPMFNHGEPGADISEYVGKTKQLFLDGSIQSNPDDRYKYCKQIFEIIKPLIPKDNEVELEDFLLPGTVAGMGLLFTGRKNISIKKLPATTN